MSSFLAVAAGMVRVSKSRTVYRSLLFWCTASAFSYNRFFKSTFLPRSLSVMMMTTSTGTGTTSTTSTGSPSSTGAPVTPSTLNDVGAMTTATSNPLLDEWTTQPFELPPFAAIQTEHFKPALEVGMKAHLDDLQAIVNAHVPVDAEPTFETVIAAYDRAGSLLSKVSGVFSNMCSSMNTKELQKVQTEMSPILSRHRSQAITLPGLFPLIDRVYQQRQEMDLSSEQLRLVERIHLDFVRAGANLSPQDQAELSDLKAQLASLRTKFQQNVLEDESLYELNVTLDDLNDCPLSLVDAARQAALQRNYTDPDIHVITLSRSLVEPFLMYCKNRELRKEAFEAWTRRGELNLEERNNIALAQQILQLRKRVAVLYGYKTFAEYQCVDRMAKTPQNVQNLLETVWEKAKVSANAERIMMEDYLKENGVVWEDGIQPWDWRFVAEQVRKAKYDLDESELKPYFSLESVRNALFGVSGELFGLEYIPRPEIPTYHPDVELYEVRRKDSKELISLFLHDNFVRPFKSSGAWMSEYRSQTKNLAPGVSHIQRIPIVSNNNNFAKGSSSATTLLSYDDARTMFHEMGHAHHGMLSDATYSRLASTNVLTDFVELPSQLLEHWFAQPEILQKYAKHYQTGEPIPTELIQKLKAAESFQQGFATIEYTICALMDMALHHEVDDYDTLDLLEFEKKQLERLGMPQGIVMRHRPPHFLHLFASEMYAAGYYVYLWAEVLDADAFGAFEESGNVFDPAVAEKARKYIYSAGNTQDPEELFRLFRGRDPRIEYMLKKKGLSTATAAKD